MRCRRRCAGCTFRAPGRGLRRHSRTLTAGMVSVNQYRAVLLPWLIWLSSVGVEPELGCEFDDMLCEFRYGSWFSCILDVWPYFLHMCSTCSLDVFQMIPRLLPDGSSGSQKVLRWFPVGSF